MSPVTSASLNPSKSENVICYSLLGVGNQIVLQIINNDYLNLPGTINFLKQAHITAYSKLVLFRSE